MGLFKNLFNKKKNTESQSDKVKVPPATKQRVIYNSEELDFEDEHEKEIERWRSKIDAAEPDRCDNPDRIVSGYEKAISLCEEFKDFCYSFGFGGSSYYDEHEEYRMQELENLLDEYLSTDYEEDKHAYEEKKRADKLFSSIKSKILKYVCSSDGVMRKNIYAQFPDEQQPIVLKALNALISDGKIKKEKQGDKLIFKASK